MEGEREEGEGERQKKREDMLSDNLNYFLSSLPFLSSLVLAPAGTCIDKGARVLPYTKCPVRMCLLGQSIHKKNMGKRAPYPSHLNTLGGPGMPFCQPLPPKRPVYRSGPYWPILYGPALSPMQGTEEGFEQRLVEVRQGWAWKSRIVKSHSSQMQAGAKSVAGGITPMNHAHCDAYPRMRTWKGIRYDRALSASPLGSGRPNGTSSRTAFPVECPSNVEFLHCHVLLLKGVLQPSYCTLFHSTPVLLYVHFLPSHFTQRSLWRVLELRQY